jgi:prevent-host-death family protein
VVTKTYNSETARLKLRDILDDVMTGGAESVIERHGKPTAVVIGYAQWQAYKRDLRERIAIGRAQFDAGEFVSGEELRTQLKAEGLL